MGAFREFFTGLWNEYIKKPLDKVADQLDNKVGKPVKDALDGIYERLTVIKDGVLDIPVKLVELTAKLSALEIVFNTAFELIVSFKDSITIFFEHIKSIPDRLHDWNYLYGIDICKTVHQLDDKFAKYPAHARTDPEVLAGYNAKKEELTAEGMITAADFVLGYVGTGIAKGVKHITIEAYKALMPIFEELMEEAKLSEESRKSIRSIAASGEFGLNAVISFLLGVTLYPAINTAGEPAWELTRQTTYKALPVRLLPEATILRMYYKGIMTREQIDDMLAKIGYNATNIQGLVDDFKYIPTISDTITWAVREAFYDDYAKEFGTDEEYPAEKMTYYGLKWGILPEELKYFWRAHWFLPSIGQGYEMLHRKVITDGDLDNLFKAADILPWWRDKLKATSYVPVGRVDVRRFIRYGIITTKEESTIRYEAMGYNHEDAGLMTDFSWAMELEDRKNLTYSQIMHYYKEMDLTADDAKAMLMGLGYPEAESEYLVSYWAFELLKEAEDEELATIFDLFAAGAITYANAMDRLNKIDMSAARANRQLAKLEKAREKQIKLLSKEDLGKLLAAEVITTDNYKEYMLHLNYRAEDIELLIKLFEAGAAG